SGATGLPSSRYLDPEDPTVRTDFQVPVEGQESPWQRAAFVFAYDGNRVRSAPRNLDRLLAYAKENPGRLTYPAPPDFTGSAFVRQVVAAKGEDAGFAYLKELGPFLYRRGKTYPKSEAELNRLFGDGQVDFAMSYDPAFVNSGVRKGQFPRTARPFSLGDGSLQNTSFVTIPANAAHPEGAKVIADLLLSPRLQAAKADPASIGNPTVLDLDRLGARRRLFAETEGSRYLLSDYGRTLAELPADRVEDLEKRWTLEVLRRSP
ncbi:MAG: ABC transporter, substrate-binding protein YnjB, partial [uncultured Thermomicrobiales bacterium]